MNNLAISNHTALKLGTQALRSYLKVSCQYELYILLNTRVSVAKDHDIKLNEGQTTHGPPSFA